MVEDKVGFTEKVLQKLSEPSGGHPPPSLALFLHHFVSTAYRYGRRKRGHLIQHWFLKGLAHSARAPRERGAPLLRPDDRPQAVKAQMVVHGRDFRAHNKAEPEVLLNNTVRKEYYRHHRRPQVQCVFERDQWMYLRTEPAHYSIPRTRQTATERGIFSGSEQAPADDLERPIAYSRTQTLDQPHASLCVLLGGWMSCRRPPCCRETN